MFYLLATDLLLLCVIVISFIDVAFVCTFVTRIKDYLLTYNVRKRCMSNRASSYFYSILTTESIS